MNQAVVFGAGNIGRGFIGQLFSESGYEVVFVDVDRPLLAALNRDRAYELQAVFNEDTTTHRIAPVRAIPGDDPEAVAAVVATAAIGATAVGVRVLPMIAPNLASGIARRARAGAPALNFIICENLKNAGAELRRLVAARAAPEAQPYLEQQVGFVDTVIGRMVPPLPPELRAANPALIRVEPYKELPVDRAGFRGGVPNIVGMTAYDQFPVYTARKLYIHNCGHALLAYYGYRLGFEYGYQALADARVRDFLYAGWREAEAGIIHEYQADPAWLRAHQEDLFRRFGNRALGDTVFRLARDPVRKLGPTDRLVAPARLAAAAGVTPEHLAMAIALAFRFDHREDPVAVDLQQKLAAGGVAPLLREICGLDPASPLGELICRQYQALGAKA